MKLTGGVVVGGGGGGLLVVLVMVVVMVVLVMVVDPKSEQNRIQNSFILHFFRYQIFFDTESDTI